MTKAIYRELVGEAFEAMKAGDFEEALSLSGEAITHSEEEPEAYIIAGAALLEMNRYRDASYFLEQGIKRSPEDAECMAMLGFARFSVWEFEQAEIALEAALIFNAQLAQAHYWWGLILERYGRFHEADEAIHRACLLDSKNFALPWRVPREIFKQAVDEAISMLPLDLQKTLNDIELEILDLPTIDLILDDLDSIEPLVSGFFSGISKADQSLLEDTSSIPNIIFLFQRNIERIVSSRSEMIEEIRVTLIQELGNYLGYSILGQIEYGLA